MKFQDLKRAAAAVASSVAKVARKSLTKRHNSDFDFLRHDAIKVIEA